MTTAIFPDTSSINIASHLVAMAQRQPTTDALLSNPRRDAAGKLSYIHTTFQELNDQSDSLASGLAALGVSAGTRTALCLKPGVEFFATTFALFKLGAIPVLIDPGIGLRNFGRCLSQAQPSVFIGIPLAHLLRRVFGWAKGTIRTNITTGRFGGISLTQIKNQKSKIKNSPIMSSSLQAPSEAAILFTSGSTGPAKGVLYTHANFDAQIQALKQMYNIQPGETDLATFPLFALFGPALGMTTVLPDMDFTRPGFVHPPNIIDPIQQLDITNMFGSPALIDRVGRYSVTRHIKLPSLRRVISAGAPASAPALERFARMLAPTTQIFTPYGATEALPVCSIGSHEILSQTRALTDRGLGVCVGRPAPNIQVRIIRITDEPIANWSDDLEVPLGQVGEIIVQGDAVTGEYFQNPAATHLAKIPFASPTNHEPRNTEIAHRMGDCGYFDEQGRLWFCGRKSQRVRLNGGDLHSTPVEAIFNTHPQVRRSALVGIMRQGVMVPVVCIELETLDAGGKKLGNQKWNSDTLTSELRELAGRFPHTRGITDFLVHPGFPVDIRHNAKINREQLAQWAKRKLA